MKEKLELLKTWADTTAKKIGISLAYFALVVLFLIVLATSVATISETLMIILVLIGFVLSFLGFYKLFVK